MLERIESHIVVNMMRREDRMSCLARDTYCLILLISCLRGRALDGEIYLNSYQFCVVPIFDLMKTAVRPEPSQRRKYIVQDPGMSLEAVSAAVLSRGAL